MCDLCRRSPCHPRCPGSGARYCPPRCAVCGEPASQLQGGTAYCGVCGDWAVYRAADRCDRDDYLHHCGAQYRSFAAARGEDCRGTAAQAAFIEGDLDDFARWMYQNGRAQPPQCFE